MEVLQQEVWDRKARSKTSEFLLFCTCMPDDHTLFVQYRVLLLWVQFEWPCSE